MNSSGARAAIVVRGLTLGYRNMVAVQDLSGVFAEGSMTAICGPNGAGKTTLLEGLAGLLAPIAGHASLCDGKRLAYLPQRSEIDRRFPIDVFGLVALGTWPSTGSLRNLRQSHRDAVADGLRLVGMTELADRPIASLSIGQFQRALFARTIAQNADVILLDEPFDAMDEESTEVLLAAIHRLHDDGRTIVAVLHDLAQVSAHFAETLLLNRCCLGWGPTSVVTCDACAFEQWHASHRVCAPIH